MSKEESFEEVDLFAKETPEVIDTEALEAEEKPADEFVVPAKFTGKSLEDVITSYTNLETEFGRKNNEVGELRQLTDEILKQNVRAGQQSAELEDDIVGFDDLISDPEAAIDKALSANPRLAALEQSIAATAQDTAHKAVLARHEDADSVVVSADFQAWIGEQPGRQKVFADASNNLDAGVAADMLDLYKSTVAARSGEAELLRDAAARDGMKLATTEKRGHKPAQSKKLFKRAELIKLKIHDPRRYEAMSPEINLAYAEGRVR
jgi:hypothetical protein